MRRCGFRSAEKFRHRRNRLKGRFSADGFPDDGLLIGTVGSLRGLTGEGNLLGREWLQATSYGRGPAFGAERNIGTVVGRHPTIKGMDHGSWRRRPRDSPHRRSSERMAPLPL